ncbi:hypothetical protein D3C71_1657250 [compost metagenome]
MPHTHIKQMALIVVTIPKACSGISLLKRAPTDITIVEMNNELPGTWFLFSLPKRGDAWLFLLKL